MTVSLSRGPVTVELQDAAGESGLPDEDEWARWIGAAIDCVDKGAEEGSDLSRNVTVRLVGHDESRHLNATYRKKSGATNVLAFTGPRDETLVSEEDRELGDIVICLPVVYREARDQGKRPIAHMAHMAVHGTLHLLGFDHEDVTAAQRMEGMEKQILSGLGFPDPYITS